jgi:hypothetical protein
MEKRQKGGKTEGKDGRRAERQKGRKERQLCCGLAHTAK